MKKLLAALLAVSLLVTGCGDDDGTGEAGGPVAADEAQIEITFTGDGTSLGNSRQDTATSTLVTPISYLGATLGR